MRHSMWRRPKNTRLALEASCTAPWTGMMAAAGSKPGMTEISAMPPPTPMMAVKVEVRERDADQEKGIHSVGENLLGIGE